MCSIVGQKHKLSGNKLAILLTYTRMGLLSEELAKPHASSTPALPELCSLV